MESLQPIPLATAPTRHPLRGHRSAWDLKTYAWLGAGHLATPGRLRLALGLAKWGSWPLLVVLLASVGPSLKGLAQALVCLAWAGTLQYLGKRVARHWGAPRPYHLGLSPNHLDQGARGGLPSSHALTMACVAGGLLALTGPTPLWALALALSAATGWARVIAGAHFPSDVLAGWCLGLAGGWLGLSGAVALHVI
jgi:undecaprenyl-diphosphatase